MLVTLSGIVVLASELQPENAEDPMPVTLSGIVVLASELHPENAEDPMLVTLSEIITLVSELQPRNAPSIILGTPSGITTLTIFSPFKYMLRFSPPSPNPIAHQLAISLINTSLIELQSSNAYSPMLVTLFGIVTLVSE